MHQPAAAPFALALAVLAAACGASDGGPAARWTGTVDTLPSGHIVVSNTDAPLWMPGEEWQVIEELRIGRADGDGPDLFGRINSLAVDPGGRIWVLESHAQELRVFGPDDGRYLGAVRLPFTLPSVPIFRNGALYGVTVDELEVPYVVRARIVRPGA